jgi:hypothetical protein
MILFFFYFDKKRIGYCYFQEKWAKLFPTIVSNARTVKVFNAGAHGNRNGALQAVCLITSSKLIFLFIYFISNL